MTVVTSKLAASTPIMTPPGSPKARNLVMTLGETPCLTAAMAEAYVTSDLGSFFCSSPMTVSTRSCCLHIRNKRSILMRCLSNVHVNILRVQATDLNLDVLLSGGCPCLAQPQQPTYKALCTFSAH